MMAAIKTAKSEARLGIGSDAMKHIYCRVQPTSWILVFGLCVIAGTLISGDLWATERGVSSWSETGGGIPAPVRVQPTATKIDPKSTTVFSEKQAFLDSILCRSISLESFEDLVATNRIEDSTITVTHFTIATDNPPRLGIWDERYQGAFATDGRQWMGVEENQLITPQTTTLTFDVPINHFGLYMTDYGDFGAGNLEFANDIGDEATAALSGEPSGNRQFFGIINSARAFRTVTLTHPIDGEFYGIDEIYYCWQGAPDAPISRQSPGRVIPD